jgi:fucose permease
VTFVATRRACYAGLVTQAIVNNIAPLLFIVFQERYTVPIELLGRLVLLNFGTQLATDLVAVRYADRIGYRVPLVLAHLLAAVGLVLLGVGPSVAPEPYLGLALAVVVYAIGGGLLEVLVSPVVEHIPSPQEGKAAAMSLLHSFYSWGQVAVVIGTTLFLAAIGFDGWQLVPIAWAIVPLVNMLVLVRVPLPHPIPEEHRTPLRGLFTTRAFGLAMVLMFAAGAAELTMSQWSSLFAEQALDVPKVVGDIAGPAAFAVLMGLGRVAYGLRGERIPILRVLIASGVFATTCYLIAALASNPLVSLGGCAACGLAISLLWPGTFSLSARRFPLGGAAMFGVLAVFGDAGAAIGPWIAGAAAEASTTSQGLLAEIGSLLPDDGSSGLRVGLLVGTVFPLLVVAATLAWAALDRTRSTGAGPEAPPAMVDTSA